MELEKICHQVVHFARETGAFIKETRENEGLLVEKKGHNDFVTRVDKLSEQRLVQALNGLLPEAGFIVEENSIDKTGEVYNWIIDPIDGTTNFIHGLFPYAISIGLAERGKMVLGVVYEVGLDECFYAWQGGGAYLNGKPIRVSEAVSIGDSLIATGFPYANYDYMTRFMDSLTHFMKHSHGIRRLGSAATDLVYVACGRFDAFYEYDLKPWDVAAGSVIVQEAGGKVSDFSCQDNFIFGREIVATNASVFNEFSETVKNIMKD